MTDRATARNLVAAALRIEHTHKSFATLTRHASRGAIDTNRALALLANNIRDAKRYIMRTVDSATLDLAAHMLLEHWRDMSR